MRYALLLIAACASKPSSTPVATPAAAPPPAKECPIGQPGCQEGAVAMLTESMPADRDMRIDGVTMGHSTPPPPMSGPSIAFGESSVNGALHPASVRSHMRQNLLKISACYEKELLKRPGLEGEIEIAFVIEPDGKVSHAQGTPTKKELEPTSVCAAGVIQHIAFPTVKDGKPVQAKYSFKLRP